MSERTAWLYLWRLGDSPKPHGDDPHDAAVSYCAARGVISYRQKKPQSDPNAYTRWAGTPGQEREVPRLDYKQKGRPANSAQSIEPVDCELYRDPSMADQLYITDSGRRYYVVFGKNPHEQLVLMRADGSDRVKLPIWQGTVSASQFRLFDGAFLLYKSDLVGAGEVIGHAPDSFTLWRETNCWPVWRVDPRSGATNRFCIPHGYWAAPRKSGGILTLLPTKAGYFFTYFVGRDDSGLYRLRDGVVQKIAKGYFLNPVVSPSGCRVAFKFIPNDNAYRSFTPDAPTITAIDLCLSD